MDYTGWTGLFSSSQNRLLYFENDLFKKEFFNLKDGV